MAVQTLRRTRNSIRIRRRTKLTKEEGENEDTAVRNFQSLRSFACLIVQGEKRAKVLLCVTRKNDYDRFLVQKMRHFIMCVELKEEIKALRVYLINVSRLRGCLGCYQKISN